MNKNRQRVEVCSRLRQAMHSQRGLTLIETLVALGIIAAVAVVYLVGMTTASKAIMVSQERVAADSLAKSQMEAIKIWEYDEVNDPPNYDAAKLSSTYYKIDIYAHRWDPELDIESTDSDTGLQKITVTITRDGDTVFTLIGYKVKR